MLKYKQIITTILLTTWRTTPNKYTTYKIYISMYQAPYSTHSPVIILLNTSLWLHTVLWFSSPLNKTKKALYIVCSFYICFGLHTHSSAFCQQAKLSLVQYKKKKPHENQISQLSASKWRRRKRKILPKIITHKIIILTLYKENKILFGCFAPKARAWTWMNDYRNVENCYLNVLF